MDSSLLLLCLTLFIPSSFLLLSLLSLRRTRTAAAGGGRTNHCPYPNPILGNLLPFLRHRRRFLDWAASLLRLSPTATIEVITPFSLSHGIATSNPSVVDHLLRQNFPAYIKGRRLSSALSDLLGNGFFAIDGRLWLLQRKIASYEFTTRSLRSFSADVFRSQLDNRLIPLLSSTAASGLVIDLQDLLRRFAFDSICTIAFGYDPCSLDQNCYNNHHRQFFDAFDEAVEISFNRLLLPFPFLWKLKRKLNVGSERQLREAIKTIDKHAMEIIESKETQMHENRKPDLLSRFMSATEDEDNNNNELSSLFKDPKQKQKFLRDVIVSFILAGKDSTSSGLTWFFWLLSANPRVEKKLYKEISQSDIDYDYEELKELNYLHAAITESLRLYPPVPINSRVATKDDLLPDGTRVRAGWFADYSAYAMGREERLWGPDCDRFVPERWLDERGKFVGADASKFTVFHAGPRMCLGKEMAYVQMKTVAAAVLRRFRVEAVGGVETPPPYEMVVTLRMKGGLPVRINKRIAV